MVYINTRTGAEVVTNCEIIGDEWKAKPEKKKGSKKQESSKPSDEEGGADE